MLLKPPNYGVLFQQFKPKQPTCPSLAPVFKDNLPPNGTGEIISVVNIW